MKRPIIIVSRIAPKKYCVNIFGTFWVRDPSWLNEEIINHERIHTAQQKELLYIPFYVLYGLEWLVRLIQYHNSYKAYKNISFEREAYSKGYDLKYLQNRKLYAWLKFLTKRKS